MILSVYENQGVIFTWTFPRLVIHPYIGISKPEVVHSKRVRVPFHDSLSCSF